MDHFLGLKPMFFSYVNSLEGSFCLQAPLFSCASPVIAVRLWVCYSWETNSSSFFLVVNPLWNNMSACLAIRFFFSSCGCSIKTYQNSPCHLIHLAFQLSLWPICWFWGWILLGPNWKKWSNLWSLEYRTPRPDNHEKNEGQMLRWLRCCPVFVGICLRVSVVWLTTRYSWYWESIPFQNCFQEWTQVWVGTYYYQAWQALPTAGTNILWPSIAPTMHCHVANCHPVI